jgi:hypothetical protein
MSVLDLVQHDQVRWSESRWSEDARKLTKKSENNASEATLWKMHVLEELFLN